MSGESFTKMQHELVVYFPGDVTTISRCTVKDYWIDFDEPELSIRVAGLEHGINEIKKRYPTCTIFDSTGERRMA